MTLVVVLHGPNLNQLGLREPELYGHQTLDDVDALLRAEATRLGIDVESAQSNQEGELIDRIQAARTGADALIINAGGYTHTSVAIRDAVITTAERIPVIEVHLTIPAAREPFRHVSLLADVVAGRIEGFGAHSYVLALHAASTLSGARSGHGNQ